MITQAEDMPWLRDVDTRPQPMVTSAEGLSAVADQPRCLRPAARPIPTTLPLQESDSEATAPQRQLLVPLSPAAGRILRDPVLLPLLIADPLPLPAVIVEAASAAEAVALAVDTAVVAALVGAAVPAVAVAEAASEGAGKKLPLYDIAHVEYELKELDTLHRIKAKSDRNVNDRILPS